MKPLTMVITRGTRNHNPLNIRIGNKWKGLKTPTTDGTFDQFISVYGGYRAAFIILRNYIRKYKCNTVRKIISRFAPSSENNTAAYIKTVCMKTGYKPDKELKPTYDDLAKLVYAMAWVESMATPSTEMLRYSWGLI